MYPHQVLMEEQNLKKEDLSNDAQNYLTDFNHFLRGIGLKQARAEKAGKPFEMNEKELSKANRLSKSVCVQIYQDINSSQEAIQAEKQKEEAKRAEAEALAKQQAEEESRIIAEQEQAKKEAEAQEAQAKEDELERKRLEEEAQAEAKRKADEDVGVGFFF